MSEEPTSEVEPLVPDHGAFQSITVEGQSAVSIAVSGLQRSDEGGPQQLIHLSVDTGECTLHSRLSPGEARLLGERLQAAADRLTSNPDGD